MYYLLRGDGEVKREEREERGEKSRGEERRSQEIGVQTSGWPKQPRGVTRDFRGCKSSSTISNRSFGILRSVEKCLSRSDDVGRHIARSIMQFKLTSTNTAEIRKKHHKGKMERRSGKF